MAARVYTYHDLIAACISARKCRQSPALDGFFQAKCRALQDLFGIHFTRDKVRTDLPAGIRPQAVLEVFWSAVDSLLAIRTPWTGLEAAGSGAAVLAQVYGEPFFEIAVESEQAHLELLETFFTLLYGRPEQVFTSEDLLRLGFDDSVEPEPAVLLY